MIPTEMVAIIVSLVSIVVAAAGAGFVYLQTTADHERSRRKVAVDLLLHWVGSSVQETSAVHRFVERLSPEECSAIQRAETLQVSEKDKDTVVSFLKSRFPDIEAELQKKGEPIILRKEHVYHIRYVAVRYLNTLEVILTAWDHSIADKEIIVSQFQYLVDEREDRNAMQTFRQKVGVEHFPSIGKFAKYIQRVREFQREQAGKQPIA